jgi:hypothetical protein
MARLGLAIYDRLNQKKAVEFIDRGQPRVGEIRAGPPVTLTGHATSLDGAVGAGNQCRRPPGCSS